MIKDQSRLSEIKTMRKAGLSYAKIGRRYGISGERVCQILKGKTRPPEVPLEKKLFLKPSDVASILNLHSSTVRRWSKKGILKAYRIGPRGDRRFLREDVHALLKKGTSEPII